MTAPSKGNGTSHPPDNSGAPVNVLMEDVSVCERERESQQSAAFVSQIRLMDLARIKSLRGVVYALQAAAIWRTVFAQGKRSVNTVQREMKNQCVCCVYWPQCHRSQRKT